MHPSPRERELMPIATVQALRAHPVIEDWLVLGPWVVETGASFEKEHFFEREKILAIDYLESTGGERAVKPLEGAEQPNSFLGPDRLRWQRRTGNHFGFTGPSGPLLYRTVQRNAVWYAATYVEAEEDTPVFVDFYHSGAQLLLNGELVLAQPYGLTKGLWVRQVNLPLLLRKGVNLLMVKVRPGFIADGIDFQFGAFRVVPALVGVAEVYVSPPQKQDGFFGPVSAPSEAFAVRVGNWGRAPAKAKVSLGAEASQVEDLQPGQAQLIRVGAPPCGPREGQGVVRVEVGAQSAQASFAYQGEAPPDAPAVGYVYTDFHFDTTYHEEQRVYAMGALDICRRYCEQLRADPYFKATISEVDYLKPYFDMFPADRETLRQAFSSGRAESDVLYNQPQEVNASGEGFVRNLVYGQLFHGDVLGRKCYVYTPGDVFGHPAQLSQLTSKGGCIACAWDKHILGFPPLFRYASPDGTVVIHRRGSVHRYEARAMGLSCFLAGADKTAPTEWLRSLEPQLRLAVPSDFHRAVEEESKKPEVHLPLTSRDMSLYHAGTALSRIELKIGNRLAENLLISAEKFSVLAGLLGAKYPELAVDKGWRQLLCGQHHDSLTGTHNEISFADLMTGYREAAELGAGALRDAMGYISRAAKANAKAGEIPLRVFNPHAWDRRDLCRTWVEVPEGWAQFGVRDREGRAVACQILSEEGKRKEIAFLAQVPSLGYTTYYLTPNPEKPARPGEQAPGNVVENEFFRLEADPQRGGGLVSLFDKRQKRELLDTSKGMVGNEISIHREVANRGETQHEMYTSGQGLYARDYPARVSVERGEVLTRLVVENELADICPTRQEAVLVNGLERIDCRVYIVDYQGEDDLFAVTLPTALQGAVPTFDDRFAAIVRRQSKRLLDFRTHQTFMFSGCAVYPTERWMDFGPTVKVDFGQGRAFCIGMTALVAPENERLRPVAEQLLLALTKKGVPVTPWSDTKNPAIGSLLEDPNDDLLYTDTRVALTTEDIPNAYAMRVLEAAGGAGPPYGAAGAAFKRQVSQEGTAILFAIDDDNDERKPMKVVVLGARDVAGMQALVSEIEAQLATGETLDASCALRAADPGAVDDYGVTLVNTGNIACSVEKGGVPTMLLFHTARWYGATGNIEGRNYVPEQRTHAYAYSLYPHAGSWREAESYRVAFEVNDPLMAVPAEEAGEAVPEEFSLLRVEGGPVAVTAVKGLGNPLAGLRAERKELPERGIAVRFYEPCGRRVSGALSLPVKVREAFKTDLLEERGSTVPISGNSVPFEAGPFSVETIGLLTEGLGAGRPTPLGAQAEAAQPVFVRSWEHDAGTMPLGYEAVVASIGRDIETLNGGALRLKVNVVNDSLDAEAEGDLRLVLPEGWHCDQALLHYRLSALGHQVFPVTVRPPAPDAVGQIKLRFGQGEQEFQDILEVGKAVEPDFTLKIEGEAIVATLGNPSSESLEAELVIACPVETWPEADMWGVALLEISPRTVGVSLAPGERRQVVFDISRRSLPVLASWWAVGKLMTNGRLYLRMVEERGRPHVWRSGMMWEDIRAGRTRKKS